MRTVASKSRTGDRLSAVTGAPNRSPCPKYIHVATNSKIYLLTPCEVIDSSRRNSMQPSARALTQQLEAKARLQALRGGHVPHAHSAVQRRRQQPARVRGQRQVRNTVCVAAEAPHQAHRLVIIPVDQADSLLILT